ncbi:MAG: hypothetical protein ABIH34_07740 [Nanoarchaeota archaeon]
MTSILKKPVAEQMENDVSFEIVRLGILELQKKYGVGPQHILEKVLPEAVAIPLSAFQSKLGSLETIVLYLKEIHGMRWRDMAILLNRDERTIWSTHAAARKKHPKPLIVKSSQYAVSLSLFKDRTYSILEILVTELKRQGLSFKDIAHHLGRAYPTVWTACRRAKEKRGGRRG